MAVSADIHEAIATWAPKRAEADPARLNLLVQTARQIVEAAKPRHATEAKLALGHVLRYLDVVWTDGASLAEVRTTAAVDAYLADLRKAGTPTGTMKPKSSALLRTVPVGSAFGQPRRARAAVEDRVEPSGPTVEQRIATYQPDARRIRPEIWERIAIACRTAVAAAGPDTPDRATSLFAPASLYLAWAEHRGVADQQLWSCVDVENFLSIGATSWPESTLRTYQSNLRCVAAAVRPEAWPSTPPAQSATFITYTTEDLQRFARAIRSEPPRRRRLTTSAFVLARGAGVIGKEAAFVTPDDVVGSALATTVAVTVGSKRIVPVVPVWASLLADLAATARQEGDRYLIGGRHGDRNDRQRYLWNQLAERSGVSVEPDRLRNSWLVWLTEQPLPAKTVLHFAGRRSLGGLAAAASASDQELDESGWPTKASLQRAAATSAALAALFD